MNDRITTPLVIDALVDTLCDRFEEAWGLGLRPDLTTYLGETPDPARSRLREQLFTIEWEQRLGGGERPSSAEYLDRFPELQSLILELEDRLAGVGQPTVDYSQDSSLREAPGDAVPTCGIPSDRFQIVREHARGGLGLVSVAVDGQLGREVALKELQPTWAGQAHRRARFVNEARITGMLEHPGIVPVYALETRADGRPYYAMKLVRGENLRATITHFHEQLGGAQNPVELRRLLGRVVDVCHSVQYAHHQGVVHRDIKPENILLGEYGETLLVDWGLAKQSSDSDQADDPASTDSPRPASEASAETVEGTVVGTPGYMAPEQAVGRTSEIGPACDIYGLGATLYCLLIGRPPHAAEGKDRALDKARRGHVIPPRQLARWIPKPLEAICLKATQPRMEDRYASAQDMLDDLERWLADETVVAYPERLSERLSRWSRRNRSWVRAASVALVMVAAVAVWAAVSVGRSRNREVQAKETAQKNLERAESNLLASLSAVETMLVRVGADQLVILPHSERVRLELLTDAQQLLSEVLASQRDDPRVRLHAAAVSVRIAKMAMWLDEFSQAESTTVQAIELLEPLPPARRALPLAQVASARANLFQLMGRATDADSEFERAKQLFAALPEPLLRQPATRLARAHLANNFGDLLAHLGRLEESKREYHRAIDQLASPSPADADQRSPLNEQARAHHGLARVLKSLGETQNIDEHFRAAMDAAERLGGREDSTPLERSLRAEVSGGFAWWLHAKGNFPAAEAELRRSLEFRKQLATDFGRVPRHNAELASAHANLSWFLSQQPMPSEQDYAEYIAPRQAEIEHGYQSSIRILEQLRQEEPDMASYLASLTNTYNNFAIFLGHTGSYESSLGLLEKTVGLRRESLARFGPTPGRFSQLGAVLHNTGAQLVTDGDFTQALIDVNEAIVCQERALEKNPDHPVYQEFLRNHFWLLAKIKFLDGQSNDSAAAFREALSIAQQLVDQLDNDLHYGRFLNSIRAEYAMTLATTGDSNLPEALALIEACQARSPEWPGYRYFGAWILSASGEWTAAEASLAEARRLSAEPCILGDLVEVRLAWQRNEPQRSRQALARVREAIDLRARPRDSQQTLEQHIDRHILSIVEREIE